MAKLVLLSFCVLVIAGIALSAPADDEDYTKFENRELLLALRKFNRESKGEVIPVIVPDSVIDPPIRCKPCYKPDIRGKCRRIMDCEDTE